MPFTLKTKAKPFATALLWWSMSVSVLALSGCTTTLNQPVTDQQDIRADSSLQSEVAVADSAWSRSPITLRGANPKSPQDRLGWQHYKLPGKQASEYTFARHDGRDAILVTALASASLLRQQVNIAPEDLEQIKFSWKVPELIAQADLGLRDNADSPVRIVLAFEGDRSKFSAKNALLSELANTLTGEPLPYATLMYVWCNTRVPGSVIISPRTDRIRKIVVESGAKNLDMWMDYERNIRADYEKAFGEPPGALRGIAIMTDTDNTRTKTRAWYGKLGLAAR